MVVIESSDPLQAADQIDGLHENQKIATQLREIASCLVEQKANPFRVRAYRAAADTIAFLLTPVRQILEHDGIKGLVDLPTIGHSIANLIESSLHMGRMPLLDRLRGENNAERTFATLAGIGTQLSHRIYEHLHVETLSELRAAAYDGRLKSVPGIGRKRIAVIQASLVQHEADKSFLENATGKLDEIITIDELLDIDRTYRERANAGDLASIKRIRRDPQHDAELPIMHTERDGRHYTVMFSDTERAYRQHATRDWVIVYRDDADAHGRWMVITSQIGKLKGLRVVSGREEDCLNFYRRNAFHQLEAGHSPYPEFPPGWDAEDGRNGLHG